MAGGIQNRTTFETFWQFFIKLNINLLFLAIFSRYINICSYNNLNTNIHDNFFQNNLKKLKQFINRQIDAQIMDYATIEQNETQQIESKKETATATYNNMDKSHLHYAE